LYGRKCGDGVWLGLGRAVGVGKVDEGSLVVVKQGDEAEEILEAYLGGAAGAEFRQDVADGFAPIEVDALVSVSEGVLAVRD
jgi:hypothetical protein